MAQLFLRWCHFDAVAICLWDSHKLSVFTRPIAIYPQEWSTAKTIISLISSFPECAEANLNDKLEFQVAQPTIFRFMRKPYLPLAALTTIPT